MNTETKFATLFIALVTVVPLLYSGIPCVRGSWAIAGFAPALWCFWMGVVIDEYRKVKWGVKAAVAVGVIAQIIAFCSVDYARLRLLLSYSMINGIYQLSWVWQCLVWLVAGRCLGPVIGKSSRGNDGRRDFAEDLLTFLGFALLYAWLIWSANYVSFSVRTYKAEALSRLHPAGYYLSYIPLFGAVWYGVRIAQSDVAQRLMNVRWLRITACAVVVLAGIFCLLCCFCGDSYINIRLLLSNPIIAGVVYGIIRGIKHLRESNA